jgi:hypothetical protein
MKLRETRSDRRLSDEQRRTIRHLMAALAPDLATEAAVDKMLDYLFSIQVPTWAPGSSGSWFFLRLVQLHDPHSMRCLEDALVELRKLIACDDWGEDPSHRHREFRALDLDDFDDEPNGNGHHA